MRGERGGERRERRESGHSLCTSCHVLCCSLDLQRLPGEEWYHPDELVMCEREVAMYQRAVMRILARPVGDREWYWGQEVVNLEGRLAVAQDFLRLSERNKKTNAVRLQHLRRQWEALEQASFHW